MAKSADAFRTISEVAEWLETPAHVLRFWESKFTPVKPVKRAGGRRYYRPQDMRLLGGIKKLLHEDGMTIKGVQKLLREEGVKHVAALSQPLPGEAEEEAAASVPAGEAATHSAQEQPTGPRSEPTVDDGASSAADTQTPAPAHMAGADEPPPDQGETTAPEASAQDAAGKEADAQPGLDLDAPATEHDRQDAAEPAQPGTGAESPTPDETQDAPTTGAPPGRQEPAQAGTGVTGQDATRPGAETEGTTAPPGPAVTSVDVPPDPDDAIDAGPGILSQLTRLPRPLLPRDRQALRPFVARLRERLSAMNEN